MTQLSRRNFLALSSISLTVGERAFAQTTIASPAQARFETVRNSVGTFTARGGTIGWLISTDGVVVVDSQFPDTAATALAGIKERSTRQIAFLINSHHHADHTGGNQIFRPATAAVLSHKQVPTLMRKVALATKTEASQVYPDTTFHDTWSAQIGKDFVSAKHYAPAHTGADIVVTFHGANVVHMGDLMSNVRHPRVDAAAGGSVSGWITTLEGIVKEHDADTIYIAGHAKVGEATAVSQREVLSFRDYLTAVVAHAERGIARGLPAEQIAKQALLPKEFGAYEGSPENAILASHAELTTKR